MTRPDPSPRVVLAAAIAAQASVAFLTLGLPAVGPALIRTYRLGLAELGTVLGAMFLGCGAALILAGWALDRFGSRRTVLAFTAIAICGLAAAAAAPSAGWLIVALLVAGAGTAVVPVSGPRALFHAYPRRRRGTALGARQMSVSLGGAAAGATLPWLESVGGVDLVLGVGALLLAASCTTFALLSPETVTEADRPGFRLASILRRPGMPALLAVGALYVVSLQALIVFAIPAARAAGLSALAASATFVAVNVAAASGRVLWGRLADSRHDPKRTRTLADAGLLAGAGGVVFALALELGTGAAVIAAAFVFAFGALGWNALLYLNVGERAPAGLAGQAVAAATTVVFLVQALVTPALGAYAEAFGWDAFWLTTALVATLGGLVASSVARSHSLPPPGAAEPG